MEVFNKNLIATNVTCKNKQEVLQFLAELLTKEDCVYDLNTFMDAINKREEMISTGVGLGLAIPHGRTDAAKKLCVAVCKLQNPVDFNSIDDEPVQFVFMIAVPNKAASDYMKILGAISKFYHNPNNQKLLAVASTNEALYNLVKEIDNEIDF